MNVMESWVNSLSLEALREEFLKLNTRYEERQASMHDTADMVRSLYAGSEVSKRITDLREEVERLKTELEKRK